MVCGLPVRVLITNVARARSTTGPGHRTRRGDVLEPSLLGEWPHDWWWRKRGTREDVTLPEMAARIDDRSQLLRSLDAFSHHHGLEIVAQGHERSDKREAPRTRT